MAGPGTGTRVRVSDFKLSLSPSSRRPSGSSCLAARASRLHHRVTSLGRRRLRSTAYKSIDRDCRSAAYPTQSARCGPATLPRYMVTITRLPSWYLRLRCRHRNLNHRDGSLTQFEFKLSVKTLQVNLERDCPASPDPAPEITEVKFGQANFEFQVQSCEV